MQVETGTEADFFARGKRLAAQPDQGEVPAEAQIVTFEDPADLESLLAQTRNTKKPAEAGSIQQAGFFDTGTKK